MFHQIPGETTDVTALLRRPADQFDAFARFALKHRRGNFIEHAALRQAEDILQLGFVDGRRFILVSRRRGERQHLFEKRLRVAHAAVGFSREIVQRAFGDLELFAARDRVKALNNLPQADAPKVEALAGRQNRRRQAVRLSRGENEFDRRRWLLEGLQKRVEGVLGDLVHLVDDVDFETTLGRLIADVFDDLADLIDATIGSAVDFEHVDGIALRDLLAVNALAAGRWCRSLLAVERLCEDARSGRLTNTAHAGEKKGVRNTLGANRVLQRAGDRLLPGYVRESLRTPFSRDHQIFGRHRSRAQ